MHRALTAASSGLVVEQVGGLHGGVVRAGGGRAPDVDSPDGWI
jgi:hypothetical protein